jgi:membrane associated rhomboid family serine protease
VFYAPDGYIPSLGASGAIAGVLGAYAIKFPRNKVRVRMMRMVTQMPAILVLGLWILLQIVSQVGTPAGEASGVAYMAHIGGFVAGLVLVMIMARRREPGQA